MPIFIADHDFEAEGDTELEFLAGQQVEVITQKGEWWYGELIGSKNATGKGKRGWFVPAFGHLAVRDTPYDGLDDKEKILKRHQVAVTIFKKESAFIFTLQEFVDKFVEPVMLLDTKFKRNLMGSPALALSFSLLHEICIACTKLLTELKNSKSAEHMAECYMHFAPSLALFGQYARENAEALNSIKHLGRNLVDFTEQCDMTDGVSLELCLILPLTQYHHYAQDLQEFVWLTPSKNAELHSLEIALATLEQESNNVDEEFEKTKEAKDLLKLQFEFAGDPIIFKPGRRIVKEGELEKVRRDPDGKGFTRKIYYAHLFNDAFVYSVLNMATGEFKIHKSIALEGAETARLTPPITDPLYELTNMFKLAAKPDKRAPGAEWGVDAQGTVDKVDVFRCDDTAEMDEWMTKISDVVMTLKRSKKVNNRRGSALAIGTDIQKKGMISRVDESNLGDRAATMYQFLGKELTFSTALSMLDKVLVQPLLDASRGEALETAVSKHQAHHISLEMQSTDAQTYLRSAEALCNGVKEFVEEFNNEVAARRWSEETCIGFMMVSPHLQALYAHYEAYGKCMLPFLRILKGPSFASFYKKCENSLPMFPGETLAEKLEVPRNRPAGYLFFLESLHDCTHSSHRDLVHITEGIDFLRSIQERINEAVDVTKNSERILDIQESFQSGMIDYDPIVDELASPGRVLIKEGDLKKVGKKSNKIFRFWLFNDMLIYGSSNGGTYVLNRAISLHSCRLSEFNANSNLHFAMELLSSEKSFIVLAPNEKQRKDWMVLFKKAKRDAPLPEASEEEDEDEDDEEEYYAQPPPPARAPWMPDHTANDCVVCRNPFGIFRHKHHCRRCGSNVCASHSNNKMILPHLDNQEMHRVCDVCYYHRDKLTPSEVASISAKTDPAAAGRPSLAKEMHKNVSRSRVISAPPVPKAPVYEPPKEVQKKPKKTAPVQLGRRSRPPPGEAPKPTNARAAPTLSSMPEAEDGSEGDNEAEETSQNRRGSVPPEVAPPIPIESVPGQIDRSSMPEMPPPAAPQAAAPMEGGAAVSMTPFAISEGNPFGEDSGSESGSGSGSGSGSESDGEQQQQLQGYPPMGYPPQGYPPMGYPPQGMPPQGFPPQGMPSQGMPPQGFPPQGMPPQGFPPQGFPPQGFPPQMMPPEGSGSESGSGSGSGSGSESDGEQQQQLQGYPPMGYPPQGYPPMGYPPQGMPPQGFPPQGMPPQGIQATPPPLAKPGDTVLLAMPNEWTEYSSMHGQGSPEKTIRERMSGDGLSDLDFFRFMTIRLSGGYLPVSPTKGDVPPAVPSMADTTVASSVAPAAAASSSTVPDHLQRYVKMHKMLPDQAVVNKMLTEGYTEAQAQQLLSGDYDIPVPGGAGGSSGGGGGGGGAAPAEAGASSSPAMPAHLEKYVKMHKMLPDQAVVNKMLTEGYTEEQARQLLKGDYNIPVAGATQSAPARRATRVGLPPASPAGGGGGGPSFLDMIKAKPTLNKAEVTQGGSAAPTAGAPNFLDAIKGGVQLKKMDHNQGGSGNSSSGGGGAAAPNFLDAIKGGVKLKHVDHSDDTGGAGGDGSGGGGAAPTAGAPNFLDAIKGGVKLKKVEKGPEPATKSQKSNAMMSELMQAMAKTRRVIAEDSDVSDSDSDGFG